MMADAQTYRTHDTPWPVQFHREITPRWLRGVATALGAASVDVDAPFVWLELGCGAGLNALVTAAAHPWSQCWAIDINPTEIARAQRIASEVGLGNVNFICADIATLDVSALPAADFIVSMGTYSWAGEAARRACDALIGQKLTAHGLACVGYMSQPGAAAFAGVRQLMQQVQRYVPGSSAEQARVGMQWAQTLADAGAGFFVDHPTIARAVQHDGLAVGAASLAHELLNPDWMPLHAAQVMQRMGADLHATQGAAAACRFIGSATALDNIDALSLPAATQSLLAHWQSVGADAAMLETLRDLARNQRVRRDIFQKQSTPALDEAAHRQALLAQRVCALPAHAQRCAHFSGTDWVLDTPIGTAALDQALIAPLWSAVQSGPRSYGELATLAAYRDSPGLVNQLIQALLWGGWLAFVQQTPVETPIAHDHDARRIAHLQAALQAAGLGAWDIHAASGLALRMV